MQCTRVISDDGEQANSHVFVSEDTGTDNQTCLLQSEVHNCRSLQFVVDTIVRKQMFWIKTIYVDGIVSLSHKTEVHLQNTATQLNHSLTITCMDPCLLTHNFLFLLRYFHLNLKITFDGVHFIDSVFTAQNFNMQFHSVTLNNCVVQDTGPRAGELGEMWVEFHNVSFHSLSSGHLALTQSFSIFLHFFHSQLEESEMTIETTNLWLSLQSSSFYNSSVQALVSNFSFTQILNSSFTFPPKKEQPALRIFAAKITLVMTDSVIEDTVGGITLRKDKLNFVTWMQVAVSSCIFRRNQRFSSGGAVQIENFAQQSGESTLQFVDILNCTFSTNEARRKLFSSAYGGALSIESDTISQGDAVLRVTISDSLFTNNQASDGGGAVYASENIEVNITDCHFSFTGEPGMPKAVFILAYSGMSIVGTTFVCSELSSSSPVNELQVLSPKYDIKYLKIDVKCLPWHKLHVESAFGTSSVDGETVLQKAVMTCTSCPSSLYIFSDGNYKLNYERNQSALNIFSSKLKSSGFQCLECPYGANCPGNKLLSKPNFWGYEVEGTITFLQCPLGYCCSGLIAPCVNYNLCAGNRAGNLCGTCKEGYSLSLLSKNCIPNNECKDYWMWPLAILGTTLYMLWYTLKDDLFSFPAAVWQKLTKTQGKEKTDEIDKGYFGIMTYYVQAAVMMRISIVLDSVSAVAKAFQHVELYISLFLTVELKYFSSDVCSVVNLTSAEKVQLNLLFYYGIFASWLMLFFIVFCGHKLLLHFNIKSNSVITVSDKLVGGLIEIVKYTYGGITDLVFYSLAYVTISGEKMWFYDATVNCFSSWQKAMIVFGAVYVVPYPLMLFTGMKFLEKKQISSSCFLWGLFLPFPFIFYCLCSSCSRKRKVGNKMKLVDKTDRMKLLERFTGGYRESAGGAQYWECVMIMRRLLLSATLLIPNAVNQLLICSILCILFLAHHINVKPFVHKLSNKAETVSLILLCIVAFMNAGKALSIQFGVSPQDFETLRTFSLVEPVFVTILFTFVLFLAILESRPKLKGQNRPKQILVNAANKNA